MEDASGSQPRRGRGRPKLLGPDVGAAAAAYNRVVQRRAKRGGEPYSRLPESPPGGESGHRAGHFAEMVDFIVRQPHPSSDVRRAEILDALLMCTHLRQRGLRELEAKLLDMASTAQIGIEELAPALNITSRQGVEARLKAAADAAAMRAMRTYTPAVAPVRRKAREVWLERYGSLVPEIAAEIVGQWKSGAMAVSGDMAEHWLDALETDLAERRPTAYTVKSMMNDLAGLSSEFQRRPPTGVEGKSLRTLHTLAAQYGAAMESDNTGAEGQT